MVCLLALNATLQFNEHILIDPDSLYVSPSTPLWNGKLSPRILQSPELHSLPDHPSIQVEPQLNLPEIMLFNVFTTTADYATDLLKNLQLAREDSLKNVKRTQQRIRTKSHLNDKPIQSFQVGQLAWLSVPLNTRATHAKSEDLSTKFLFKWSGPVRIVGKTSNTDRAQYKIVETYPGGEITSRLVHASRLRPFTFRIPVDSAEKAADESGDDFQLEIESWQNARHLKRRPTGLKGTDPRVPVSLLGKRDDEFDEEDITTPRYNIERILKIYFDGEKFQYLTKWEGWSHHYNT